MKYDEIEMALKAAGKNSVIERLRVAVGEESDELAAHGELLGHALVDDVARERYAASITEWLEGGKLDPETLLGRRARYPNSWAFAEIIRPIYAPDIPEEDRDYEVGEEVLLRMCEANAQLASELVNLIDQVKDLSGHVADNVAVQHIKVALTAARVPELNEHGRQLYVWERIENVLVDYGTFHDHENEKSTECDYCVEHKRDVKNAADHMIWIAQTVHNGNHIPTEPRGLGWKSCTKGVCGSMGQMLGQIGFDKDLKPTEKVP